MAGHNSDGERCIHRPSQNIPGWKGPTRPIPVQLPGQKLCRALCCPGQKPAWVSFQKALTRGSWPRTEGREERAHRVLLFPCWHRAQGRLKPLPSRRTQGYERAAPSPLLPPKLAGFPRSTSQPVGPRPPPAAPRPVLTARCRRLTPPSRGRPEEGGRGRPGGEEFPAGPTRPAGCPRERCRPRCAAAAPPAGAGAGSSRSSGGSGQPRAAAAERDGYCACANGAAPAHGAGGAGSRPCLGVGFVKRFLCSWVLIMSHTWSVQPRGEETKGEASALLTTSARGVALISSLSWPVTGPEGMA